MKTNSVSLRQSSATFLLSGLTAFSTMALMGCSPSFKADASSQALCVINCSSSNTGSSVDEPGQTPGPNTGNESAAWKSLELEGAVSGGRFDKTQAVVIDKTNKQLIVRLPMLANPFLDGATLNLTVPNMPGAKLGLETLADGGSALVLRIPLELVLRGVDVLSPSRLPNGDSLPSIPEGALPSVALRLSQARDIRATIYLSPTVVGLYVNTPFDPFVRLTVPVRNSARTQTLGYFTTIPAKSGIADGGFFLSIALPDDVAHVIDDNI